jgi:hypothetical protein
MRKNGGIVFLCVMLVQAATGGLERLAAQAPAGPAQAKAPVRPATATAAPATLAQLMKGILYPASNVIFAAQNKDPADITPAKEPSTAPNPLESTYGKWEAVENAGLAMSEAANLLTLPGRKCGNGRAVPTRNADWAKFVQGVREAGLKAYEAGKSKDQDKVVDAADVVATACANCHDKYREKPNLADRCM